MHPPFVVEVRLGASGAERLLDVVEALEGVGAAEIELADEARPPRAWGRFEDVDPARCTERLQSRLHLAGLQDSQVRVESVVRTDWDSVVQLGLRPAWYGPLVVVPADFGVPEGAELALEIEAKGAFGSGLHPTTSLVLDWLVRTRPESEVLDLGTGTGILALAALRLGAKSAVATDVDPRARAVAKANARRNGLEDRMQVLDAGPGELGRQFSVVLANVLAAPLTELASDLVRALAPGSQLILSGVQPHQSEDVIRAYRNCGLWWTGQTEQGGWLSLELRPSW